MANCPYIDIPRVISMYGQLAIGRQALPNTRLQGTNLQSNYRCIVYIFYKAEVFIQLRHSASAHASLSNKHTQDRRLSEMFSSSGAKKHPPVPSHPHPGDTWPAHI